MKKTIQIAIFFLGLSFVKAQDPQIYERHFVKKEKILFRITAPNKKIYESLQNGPLKVTRYELQNGNLVNETVIEKILMKYWKADTANWMKLMRKDQNKTGFVYQALFQNKADAKLSPDKREKQEKMLFDMLMLSCDFDSEIAKACGLFFVDSVINQKAKYVYRVDLYTSPATVKELLRINVDASVLSVNKKIDSLETRGKNKLSTLKWKAKNYSSDYSGYNIERSEDSLNFKRINQTPVILLSSQFDQNREFITCKDTMPEINKKYYYRLKGINFFGEESEPSNTVSNFNSPVINSIPLIDSIRVIKNKQVFIRWRMEKSSETGFPKNYIVMRAEKDNGKYSPLVESKVKLEFTDSNPLASNFYKIAAVTFNGDTIYSYSRMALIIDTIAPAAPVGLKATADKKGNVIFQWQKNKEKDIRGYKLFKANSKSEEFVQMNNKFIADTFYSDKLNLKTLSKKIYYALAASDNNFNTSPLCIVIEVKRPDTIAPVVPTLKSLSPRMNGVKLNFILSKSEDVVSHTIVRKSETENKIEDLKVIASGDTSDIFVDTTAVFGQTYSYLLKASDADSNFAFSNILSLRYETGFRKKLTDLNFSVDRKQKNISLSWAYKESDIEKFVLYRGNEKEALTIIKTLGGNILSYVDKTPNMGNVYEYRIKAVLYNGAESIISDAVKVTY